MVWYGVLAIGVEEGVYDSDTVVKREGEEEGKGLWCIRDAGLSRGPRRRGRGAMLVGLSVASADSRCGAQHPRSHLPLCFKKDDEQFYHMKCESARATEPHFRYLL
jgi:hypothetical protein